MVTIELSTGIVEAAAVSSCVAAVQDVGIAMDEAMHPVLPGGGVPAFAAGTAPDDIEAIDAEHDAEVTVDTVIATVIAGGGGGVAAAALILEGVVGDTAPILGGVVDGNVPTL